MSVSLSTCLMLPRDDLHGEEQQMEKIRSVAAALFLRRKSLGKIQI